MKHSGISGAIRRLSSVSDRLADMKSKILGEPLGNKVKPATEIEEISSLIEVLETTPARLEELRAEMIKKIEEIEELIF